MTVALIALIVLGVVWLAALLPALALCRTAAAADRRAREGRPAAGRLPGTKGAAGAGGQLATGGRGSG